MSKQKKKNKKEPSIKNPKKEKDLTGDAFVRWCRENQCGRKAQ